MPRPVSISANDLLTELQPVAGKALDRHLATATEWFPHDLIPYQLGRSFEAEPWRPADSRLGDVAKVALELNLLTEDNLPYYHLAIWEMFGGDGPWGEWIRRWTAEEGRHSIAIRDYLVVTRGVDPVQLERGRMDHVSRGFYPGAIPSPLDGLVYVTIQELATRIAHRNTGAITGDPVAERMMTRIAIDENLHYVFYRDVTAGALAVDPSATVLAMHRQILGFTMPGFELPGFREKAIRIASAGIYDLRIHHDQVLTPVLRHWKLPEIGALTDEAARAREEILDHMERLDDAADRFDTRRAS